MAEKGGGEARKPSKWLTVRLYVEDGQNLSDLADHVNATVADVFRRRFADAVKKELIAAVESKLKNLKK